MEEKIDFLFSRGVEEIISESALRERLRQDQPLRVKYGVDPTTADLHLGHYAVLRKLRQFQELGHKVILLIGGFTARFGDPTDKLKVRELRPKKEVEKMARSYLDQARLVLDMKRIEVRDNSEWYDKMNLEKFLQIVSRFNYARLIERDMFQERIKKNKPIRMHELLYPVLQAYDSVVLEADVALGGTDQKFNELLGREIQKELGQTPQEVVLLKILTGTDGKEKMSQSLGNDIPLALPAQEIFAKIMSIPDGLIFEYFEMLTDVPREEIDLLKKSLTKGGNPRDIKMRLALEIVQDLKGKKEAQKAKEYFVKVFSQNKTPQEVEEVVLENKEYLAKDLLVALGLVSSKSEAQRLIEQKAVEIDGSIIDNPFKVIKLRGGEIVRVGKYRFKKIKV
ncbi:tyrosine--tRNA ligase [bacterium]|nr:tyrosine--tRNA ligase [bacterium]